MDTKGNTELRRYTIYIEISYKFTKECKNFGFMWYTPFKIHKHTYNTSDVTFLPTSPKTCKTSFPTSCMARLYFDRWKKQNGYKYAINAFKILSLTIQEDDYDETIEF